MRTYFKLIVLLIVINFSTIAQWTHQNSGTDKRFLNLHFLNEYLGWACGYDGTIVKTTNGGTDWISLNIGTLDDIHAIFFVDSLVGWAVLYEFSPSRHGSIIKSTDGGVSWNLQFNIQGYTFHSIHFNDENNGWVVGSSGIAFHTTDGGNTWLQQYPNTQGGWLWPVFFIDNNFGWTAGDPIFGMFKSTDGGNNWSSTSLPVVERVYSLIFLDSQTGWLSAAQGQIAKSIDGGTTWENFQSGTSQHLRDIYFTSYSAGWSVGYNGTIINSTDGGNSWEDQFSGTSSNLYSVQFIDEQIGWTIGDNGVILKTNNGGIPVELVSFSAVREGNQIQLSWITTTELNNQGFEIERKLTDDWEKIGFVNGNGTTTEMQYYSFTDDIRLVNNVDIIYYRLIQIDFDGTFEYSNEVTIELSKPSSYLLNQNYPNPFNPSTKINWQLPESKFVTLKIYDILGNEVATLVNEEKPAGNFEVEFSAIGGSAFGGNAYTLPSGIYYYKLVAGNFIDVKKMILLK
jgi:photosystem II stability/assembly factor-like uncharacterized protein